MSKPATSRALTELRAPARVEQAHPRPREIRRVARHHDKVMDKGGRGDQRLVFALRIGNMQFGAFQRHGEIDGKDSVLEPLDHLSFKPFADNPPRSRIAMGQLQRTELQLQYRYRRNEHFRRWDGGCPRDHGLCGAVRPPQFRHDIRIDKIGHSNVAERMPRPILAGSQSTSMLAGSASAASKLSSMADSRL